jgi:hypothetical protein
MLPEARRTYKAVLSAPKIVPAPGEAAAESDAQTDRDGDVAMAREEAAAAPGKRGTTDTEGSKKKKIKK